MAAQAENPGEPVESHRIAGDLDPPLRNRLGRRDVVAALAVIGALTALAIGEPRRRLVAEPVLEAVSA